MDNITESKTMGLIGTVSMLMLGVGVVLTWATTNPFFYVLIGVGIVGVILTVCIFSSSEENLNV